MGVSMLGNLGSSGSMEVSVHFSGGSDSTLAAFLMSERFKKVHLLTFVISAMDNYHRCQVHVRRLQARFGSDKVVHQYINLESLFRTIYYGNYLRDVSKYKLYLSALFCAGCIHAMHTRTIIYNLENGISFACDGQQAEFAFLTEEKRIEGTKPLWSEQMQRVLELEKSFYAEYGIKYFNPVYDIERTDWELYQRGFLEEKNLKTKGRTKQKPNKAETFLKETEHTCTGPTIGEHYLIHYFFPIYGWKKHEKLSVQYFQEKIKVGKDYIQNHFEDRGVNIPNLGPA